MKTDEQEFLDELWGFVLTVETWVRNPASSYSVYATQGLFSLTMERIEQLKKTRNEIPLHSQP